ncbi:hypothetical protein [Chryseolinea lacunae]|uniref:SprB repeat-containing protein n=1 Tax=Chryseolinea lacunae TaxID=2801331 RepID=A0ABS1KVX9_9BACT|nr:hypothetical protein [Chryseolinea lacunae]MBL0743595.1 hypothetical protein [Chryseolinea lacunae]
MQKFLGWAALACFAVACSKEEDPIDCEKSGLFISLGTVVDATACGTADGSLKVFGSGGKEPYQFSLNGQTPQDLGQFNSLTAGIYNVTLKDANGCSTSVDNVTIKALDFSFAANILEDKSCLGSNGEVTIDVNKGNAPYQYKLGTGSFGDSNTFTGLEAGNHSITVKDNTGCLVTLSVTVPRGFSGTSWTTDIKPIIETKCALSGCHNGTRPDLRVFDNAKLYAKSIKSKTQDRSMPFEGSLTDAQIALIACWVDDGALAN